MFEHKSYIFLTEEKMKALGCKEFEFVTRREDIFLCIINYLGCVTLTQFNELTKKTPMSNRAILTRLVKERLITADHINKEIYYRCTKKGIEHLRTFSMPKKQIKIKKRMHLKKINDFYLHLFRSPCTWITLEHEVMFKYGDLTDTSSSYHLDEIDKQYVHYFIADAQMKMLHKNNKYNLILEQDNGTERNNVLKDKIRKYLNFILHQKLRPDEIEIFIFRVDIDISSFQLKKFNKEYAKEIENYKDELEQLSILYKEVKDSNDLSVFYEEARELNVKFNNSKSTFLKNISSQKTSHEYCISLLKDMLYNEFKSPLNTDRLKDIKNLLAGEIIVDKFYNTMNDSIFYDITRHTSYSFENSRIEIEDIMLRANFACGDNKLDYYLFYYLFGEIDYFGHSVKSYLFEKGYKIDIQEINKKQKSIKFGYKTVNFDFATTINVNGKSIDFIILYPSIFISDQFKLKYISSLKGDLIDSSINNSTVFMVVKDKTNNEISMDLLKQKKCEKVEFFIKTVDDYDYVWKRPFYL